MLSGLGENWGEFTQRNKRSVPDFSFGKLPIKELGLGGGVGDFFFLFCLMKSDCFRGSGRCS